MAARYVWWVRDEEGTPPRVMEPDDVLREVKFMQGFVARHLRQLMPWVEELTMGELREWHEQAMGMVKMELGQKDPFANTQADGG